MSKPIEECKNIKQEILHSVIAAITILLDEAEARDYAPPANNEALAHLEYIREMLS